MNTTYSHTAARLAALSLALGLGACTTPSGVVPNHGLESVNQPVVSRSNMTLDLLATPAGLAAPEQVRLGEWFETLDVGYGDRIAIDDPMASAAVRADVAAAAARHGLLLEEGAPVTVGFVDPGRVRVVVTRSTANVPGCPNWSGHQNGNLGNSTSPGFGCAINGNLAAMIANPEHLLEGAAGTGETTVMSSTKAIESFRERAPSGAGGNLPAVSTQSSGS